MEDYVFVGKRVASIDALARATGDAKFAEDIALPRMLYGKILRSPHPHARLLNVDVSGALALPGVKAVVTGKDATGAKYGLYPTARDQHPLAVDKVRYIGDEVAAVAAIDEDTATEALELIRVDYEPLPAVYDPWEAIQDGAPQIHDHVANNKTIDVDLSLGDVEAGFAKSYHIREDKFETEAIGHAMLEPYIALASFDNSGRLEIYTPNQSPFTKRRALANCLKLPLNQVRVLRCHIGGAFGGRSEMMPLDFCASLLSMRTGRPVKIVYTREETFTCTRQKHPWIVTVKTGVDRNGVILAKEFDLLIDGGAYASTGGIAVTNPLSMFLGLFRIPAVHYRGVRAYTNKPVRGAMKGHGNQQLRFADGSQMDMIAEDLGIDPVDIRLRNAIQTGDLTLNRSKVHSCGLRESIDSVVEVSGWKEKRGNLRRGKGIGIGVASMICGFGLGVRTASAAMVKFNEDGSATLITGTQDNGQGNWSMMVQIAAEELGLAMEDIKLTAADTELTPQDPGTYTMSTSFVSANAVKAAAFDAKQQLLEVAAEKLEANASDLVARNRRIYVKGSPDKSVSIPEIVWASMGRGKPVMGKGYWQPEVDDMDWVKGKVMGQTTGAFAYGAVVAEVEVDVETGVVKLTKVFAAQDCGRAINPAAVEGQMEGSVAFGLGQVLVERLQWDGGQALNPSFLDYKFPISLDTPDVISQIVESIDPNGPFGAKEAGEAVGIALIPAICNAVYDATGIRFRSLPIAPENVLKAL